MAITGSQALEFFRSHDLIGLGMEADTLRQSMHPEGVVTYTIDRIIHYAGFCENGAEVEGRALDFDAIYAQVAETAERGGSGVSLAGHADLQIEWFERLLRGIRQRFPRMWLHCFSAPEILSIATLSGLSVRDTIDRLRDAGLGSITGSAADVLDDDVRRRTEWRSCSTEEWLSVHRAAHELGMRTTASMMFGLGETLEQRVNHLELVRRLQEATGGFVAFTPWNFQPNPPLKASLADDGLDQTTSAEYLKTLAISRLYLDNIENLQCSGEAQDLKVLQLGLRFGGNDAGSAGTLSGTASAGNPRARAGSREEDLRRVIREAGFRPVQRDTLYTACFLN